MTRWYVEKKREHFYKEAKKQGYRARSSYKLKQIQKKYHVISPGDTVVDLGAAPGGWSQVAKENCGSDGFVVGIDLLRIPRLDGVVFLQGDVTEEETIERLRKIIENREIRVVLSDMSPNISGNYSIDHARSIFLSENALEVAKQLLTNNGNFVCKVFMGEFLQEFTDQMKSVFGSVKFFSPPASRKTSSEIYIVGKSYKKH